MLEIIICSSIILMLLAFGSWLVNRAPAWLFYSLAVPAVTFLLWKVGAIGWLFGAY